MEMGGDAEEVDWEVEGWVWVGGMEWRRIAMRIVRIVKNGGVWSPWTIIPSGLGL